MPEARARPSRAGALLVENEADIAEVKAGGAPAAAAPAPAAPAAAEPAAAAAPENDVDSAQVMMPRCRRR